MSEEKSFDLMAAAAELTSEGTSDAETGTVESAGQAEAPELNAENVDPREILNQVANEPVAEIPLDQINSLGLIHNGQPLQVKNAEELKELIQKGYDYTKKTMAHSEEVKLKTEEFMEKETKLKEFETALVQKEQEYAEVLTDNQVFSDLLATWQKAEPELFAFIQQAYQEKMSQFQANQPIIAKYEGKIQELENKFNEFGKSKTNEELTKVKAGWENELSDVQTRTAASLSRLGVKVDWEKVKETWSSDATNKMTVEDALYAAFGKDIAKANQSYQKLLATKNKTQASKIHRTGVYGGQRSGGGEEVSIRPGDYENLLRSQV